jgi:hypothetical protein
MGGNGMRKNFDIFEVLAVIALMILMAAVIVPNVIVFFGILTD